MRLSYKLVTINTQYDDEGEQLTISTNSDEIFFIYLLLNFELQEKNKLFVSSQGLVQAQVYKLSKVRTQKRNKFKVEILS